MRVSRLYLETELHSGTQIELDDDASHYLRTVLRLKINADLILFNGSGYEFSSRLKEISRKQVVVEILTQYQPQVESSLRINFGLAVSRSERMDFAIQKSVELGVSNISPLLTEHCVVRLQGEKAHKKSRHWQKIARHAAEQSGRVLVPKISSAMLLTDWIDQQQGLKIFLDPRAQITLAQLTPEHQQITLLSGPEGGFSEQERSMALASGFYGVKLGPRILRTETAGLAAIAALQMLWGDFN